MTITQIIITITAITSYLAFNNPKMMMNWMFNPYAIKTRNQYYRFLTSGFIHKDWGHLLFNMFTLYFLRTGVEKFFVYYYPDKAGLLYLSLYIAAIIISGLPSYLKHKEHIYYNSLGASGGVSALVFSFIILAPTTTLCLFFFICLPGFILGALYLIYTIQMSRKQLDNINHDAHLWGAIFGALFLLVIDWEVYVYFFQEIKNYSIF